MARKGGNEARDCLYLNWAIPAERMPPPPAPLRYDVRDGFALASTVLYRLERTGTLGLLAPGHPQLDFHVCTLDEAGRPSFFMHCVLIPTWVLPGARLMARLPAHTASFDFPGPRAGAGERNWRVCRRDCLDLSACEGAPAPGVEPDLGSWRRTVTFFQRRRRGYYPSAEGLRPIDVARPEIEVVPMSVEVRDAALVERCLGLAAGPPSVFHSAWFCPEVPFAFARSEAPTGLPKGLPAPG